MKILNSVLIACAWWVAQVSAVVIGIHIYYEYFLKKKSCLQDCSSVVLLLYQLRRNRK